MKPNHIGRVTKVIAKVEPKPPVGKYFLKLYVAGATDRSRLAVLRARQLCKTKLHDNYNLEVIDVYQLPALARSGQIIVTPTLVREFPGPVRRFIGNLADTRSLLVGQDLNPTDNTHL
jgi:circadian clock protein KaiB